MWISCDTIPFAFSVAAGFLFGKPSYKAQLDSKNQEIAKIKVHMEQKRLTVRCHETHKLALLSLYIEDVNGRCQKIQKFWKEKWWIFELA